MPFSTAVDGSGPGSGGAEAIAEVVGVLLTAAGSVAEVSGAGLLECFARVEDPRDRRGVRYSLASILGLCTAAVAAGEITLVEITSWISGCSQELLAAVGCRQNGLGRFLAPHPDTIERVFAALGAQDLADQVGAHLMRGTNIRPTGAPITAPVLLPAIAVDGKAMRGAVGADGKIPFLLAAATHQGCTVIAERAIGAKSNEVPQFQPLLRGLAVGGCVLTMDAGHTVRAHARFIVAELMAHYVMIVKGTHRDCSRPWTASTGLVFRSLIPRSIPRMGGGRNAPSRSPMPRPGWISLMWCRFS
ncbi:MAG TPA: transposase family protein [Polyangia bacterium]